MINGAFIDTDIIIKIGEYKGNVLLEKVLKSYGLELYVHEYILEVELLIGEKAKTEISTMIEKKN